MTDTTLAQTQSTAAAQVSSLEALHLKKAYGSRKVVHDVSVKVNKGEVVGLLGPNGAGKTTSFYMIVGLVRTDGGQILIDGQDVTNMPIHRRARMGLSYLPQEASIFRKLNVADNVRAVLELQRDEHDKPLNEAAIQAHIQARADAKAAKDFAEADRIRKLLLEQGIELKDSAAGTTWEAAQ